MQASQVPVKMPTPWATGAPGSNIQNPIPIASQIGITAGAASFTDGFPPLCFLPTTGGGVPPWGRDFNGILFMETSWSRWLAAGGPIQWDSTFSAAVSGYPKGAAVQSATTFGKWYICTAENNTSNPDTGGSGWFAWSPWGKATQDVTASGAFTTTAQSVRLNRTTSVAGSSTTLPASPVDGQEQYYSDVAGNFQGFNLTINANTGQTIGTVGGGTGRPLVVLNQNYQVARFEWVAAANTWSFKP